MKKRWTRNERIEESKVKELSAELNDLPETLCELLIQRGIDTYEKAKDFFRPSLENLHDPFLMKDMDVAVERIERAIEMGENILIYGDYDVDGTTSVTLVYSFLKQFYPNLDFYIPDRYKEGYGVSFLGIDYAADNDISLIIALDCGIKAIDKVDYANEKGIDFIICDHHTPGDQLPKAVAVLDPKRKDCNYPFKDLSGCGVGYKLMQALSKKRGIPDKALYEKLDILAVSICADIVPITGENRIFTYFGIKKLNQDPLPAFKTMLELAGKKTVLNTTDVVFTLAPRINAAGRLESGMRAVELLIAEHPEELMSKSKHIDNHNTDRRELDKSITLEALNMIEGSEELLQKKTTVLYHQDWHKGVIGIVASRCIERYYRPTVILTESNGKIAGSARSVKGFSVYDALAQCEDVLEQFGGHMYAAGMTLKKEQLKDFQDRFEEVVSASITEEMLTPEVDIDADLELSEISSKFYRVLEQFAPFGPENMRPQFRSTNVVGKHDARIVGNNHLKCDIEDPKNPGIYYPAIGFSLGDKLDLIKSGAPIDVVYTVEKNEFRGKVSLQLNIKDIKQCN